MKAFILALGIAAGFSATSAAQTTTMSCALTSDSEIAHLFDVWNASLETQKPEEVAKLYSDDAILLPTVSNVPRLTQAERIDYFVHFLENKPRGTIDMRVIRRGCNDATDAGPFTFADGRVVHARYSFTYVLRDGKWLIQSHHSSAMPEQGNTAQAQAKHN